MMQHSFSNTAPKLLRNKITVFFLADRLIPEWENNAAQFWQNCNLGLISCQPGKEKQKMCKLIARFLILPFFAGFAGFCAHDTFSDFCDN
jgi:hypothetical protein